MRDASAITRCPCVPARVRPASKAASRAAGTPGELLAVGLASCFLGATGGVTGAERAATAVLVASERAIFFADSTVAATGCFRINL